MRPTRSISVWLSDYDHRLEIHWSDVVSAWVIERKTRIRPLVLAAFKARLRISYNNTESDSEESQRIIDARLLARMEIEAMGRGNRWLFAVAHPLNEGSLKRQIVSTDTWIEASPEQMDPHKALRKNTDAIYDRMAAERKRKVNAVKEMYRYRLRDFAPHFFRRLGQRASVQGLKKQSV